MSLQSGKISILKKNNPFLEWLKKMDLVKRKVTYRLYPSKTQSTRFEEMLTLHRQLYNAALEERIYAYKYRQRCLSYLDQAKELTLLRAELPEYKAINAKSCQLTLKRIHEAMQHFFRRVKEKQGKAGFPRFKSADRFTSFGYPSHGSGWKFIDGKDFINGKLKISGVGKMTTRGRARFQDKRKTTRNPGTPKTLQVMKKNGQWFASITYETPKPYRESGEEVLAFDWGVRTFATLVSEKGEVQQVKNPKTLKKSEQKLKIIHKILSRKKKGSKNRQKAKQKVKKLYQKVAYQRNNFLHQTSTQFIKQAKYLGTEELSIIPMTARGEVYKTGLNKAILDTAPGKFLSLLEFKAEEAGIPFVLVNTRKLKPTQTCSNCGHQEKKTLSERIHQCKNCETTLDRDVNAAIVILNFILSSFKTGREPPLGVEKGVTPLTKHEASA